MTPQEFQEVVWTYYAQHKRSMPWREQSTPYYVLVSEIMLQQTQVPRVLPKFAAFIARFPTMQALAAAPLSDVLSAWSGLGYNRRAKFLWMAAQQIQDQGVMPNTFEGLVALPGVGPNTAGAILAYAFNKPVVFVETNIRTVFIHHFFADEPKVADAHIREKVAQTLPSHNIREWYWALMDYGTHLKATAGNRLQQVSGYKKQSAFSGSVRQVRGQVVRALLSGARTLDELKQSIDDPRLPDILRDLEQEGLIRQDNTHYAI